MDALAWVPFCPLFVAEDASEPGCKVAACIALLRLQPQDETFADERLPEAVRAVLRATALVCEPACDGAVIEAICVFFCGPIGDLTQVGPEPVFSETQVTVRKARQLLWRIHSLRIIFCAVARATQPLPSA